MALRLNGANKFNARKTELDGYRFDSQKEARRYMELVWLRGSGDVRSFEVHPAYRLVTNGQDIGRMTLDFEVIWSNGEITCEDVKSPVTARTEAYRLRRKVFEACHAPLTITEV